MRISLQPDKKWRNEPPSLVWLDVGSLSGGLSGGFNASFVWLTWIQTLDCTIPGMFLAHSLVFIYALFNIVCSRSPSPLAIICPLSLVPLGHWPWHRVIMILMTPKSPKNTWHTAMHCTVQQGTKCWWPGRSCGHLSHFYSIQAMASRLPKELTWHWGTFSVKFLPLTWHQTNLATKYWPVGSLVAK